MLGFFPDIYPDELLYSQLARYYTKSGYTAYIFAAEELYEKRTVKPDIEFLNPLTKNAFDIITKNISCDSIIKNHTMFSYYARFLNRERRNLAYQSLLEMKGNFYNLLAIPKNKENRYLRYCPVCTQEDRELYGETYWHRIHQMIGVNVCPIHNCYLLNSDVLISSRASPALITAEEKAMSSEVNQVKTNIEFEIAKYVMNVFNSDIDMDNDISAGDFLHSQMANTKYRSVRGRQRNMKTFSSDFQAKFKDLDCDFKESWQLQKVLNGYRTNTYEICLIAILLNIPYESLVNMKLPEKSQEEIFDEKVRELHNQGLKYPEIAKRLNASYNVVKPVGEGLYGKYSYELDEPKMRRIEGDKWTRIDYDTLPLVVNAIELLKGNNEVRPKKISVGLIEKFLKLPCKRIYLLPMCKAEIEKHYETQEQYWARELSWAVNKLKKENHPVNYTRIKLLTNMRKENLKACIPYIQEEVLRREVLKLL